MLDNLLVAPPAQDDEYWAQSVVLLYEETPKAVIGLTLNKPSDRKFSELAEHNNISYNGDEMLYIGGPVNPNALVMLHTDDWACSNTMQVGYNLRISSDKTMIKRLCTGDKPKHWRLFLGMSAWTPSQLQAEIDGNPPYSKKRSWLVAPPNLSIIFDDNPTRMWKRSIDLAAHEMVESFFTIA